MEDILQASLAVPRLQEHLDLEVHRLGYGAVREDRALDLPLGLVHKGLSDDLDEHRHLADRPFLLLEGEEHSLRAWRESPEEERERSRILAGGDIERPHGGLSNLDALRDREQRHHDRARFLDGQREAREGFRSQGQPHGDGLPGSQLSPAGSEDVGVAGGGSRMEEAVEGRDLLRPVQDGDVSRSPLVADLVERFAQSSLRRGMTLEQEGDLARADAPLLVGGRGSKLPEEPLDLAAEGLPGLEPHERRQVVPEVEQGFEEIGGDHDARPGPRDPPIGKLREVSSYCSVQGMEEGNPDLLSHFLAADSWDDAREILEDHPEMLGDEVLFLLAAEIERHGDDPDLAAHLTEERRFLLECRRIGIEAAFRERMIAACEGELAETSFDADPATWVGLTLELASSYAGRSLGDRSENLERALAAYERALERFHYENGPESWIATMNNRALLYTERIVGRHEDNMEEALAIYHEILARGTEEAAPAVRASVLNNLGKTLCERPGGDRLRNLAEAAERFQEAVEIYAREEMWEEWALGLTNLGTIQLEPPAGGPEDLTGAIEMFRKALSVLSFESHPEAWARALINLGNAHRERSHSGRARDVEVAIRLYRRVLRKLARERYPGDWGTAQLNLAIAWIDRNTWDRGESLERAIEACESGLAVVRQEDFPDLWAQLQSNLGTALDNRVHGSRAENQERAITALTRALGFQKRAANPFAWAETLSQLANVYRERILGLRAKNVETAIRMYHKALEVLTRESLPYEWAATRTDLSAALLQRVLGDPSDNLEEAIRGCREVLKVVDRRKRPLVWSYAMVDLAVAHVRRALGDRARNVEDAIEACRQALEIQTREAMPFEWARLMSNLGLLLLWRMRDNRAENLEEALAVSRGALEVLTPEVTPYEWADTLNNLGLVYLDREREGRAANLEKAISCFQQALSVRTRDAAPRLWGQTLSNLGNAWHLRLLGNSVSNSEAAIEAYEGALESLTRQDDPLEWSGVKSNLASAYLSRGLGDREENLERALAACREALEVRTRRSMPVDWAGTLNTLGLIYTRRLHGGREENRARAVAAFQEALQVVTAESLPVDFRRLRRNLGNLFFSEGSWKDAAQAYGEALQAAEILYQSGVTPEGRSFELGENRDLVPRATYCLARTGEIWGAVELLERWKTRSLAEALSRNEALLGRLPEEQRITFRRAVERIRFLETEAREAGLPGARQLSSVLVDLRAAREELARIVEALRSVEPDFLPEGLDALGIRAVARSLGRPLAYLITTPLGSLVLLLRPQGELEAVWADTFREADLDSIVYELDEAGGLGGGRDYLRERLGRLSRLGVGFAAPLAARLRQHGDPGVMLILGDRLGLLPIHAAPYPLDGGEVCLLDEVEVSQVPSARALGHALVRLAGTRPARDLLAVGNPLPLPEGLLPLEFAATEVTVIAAAFAGRSRLLTGEEAVRREVVEALWSAGYLHLACHGRFDPDHPLETGVVLAHGERLTVRDLLDGQPLAEAGRPSARLSVLSACESAIIESKRAPDEAVGLPAVFLQAGVPGVVGSLWEVDDLSTTLLMIRFYEHLTREPATGVGAMTPTAALRRAQLWLRDATTEELLEMLQGRGGGGAVLRLALEEPAERPFRAPYYWAPFVCVGL